MRVISRRTLRQFWEEPGRADAEQSLRAWFAEVEQATWKTPADIKAQYRNASILKKGRVVFNVCGNRYRLVVAVKYGARLVFIRFLGTHAEYDRIDADEV